MFTAEAQRERRDRDLYLPSPLPPLRLYGFHLTAPIVVSLLIVWLSGLPAFWLSLRPGDYSAALTFPHVVRSFPAGLALEMLSGKPGSNSSTVDTSAPSPKPSLPPMA